jgi:Domain of unknown function (DUF4214)/Metallo-peptidase family M12
MRKSASVIAILLGCIAPWAQGAGLLRSVIASKATPPAEIVRPLAVTVDMEAFAAAGPKGTIELSLPNGTGYLLAIEKIERTGEGQSIWSGVVRGTDSRFYGATGPGGSYARFETPEGSWGLMPGDGHDWLFDATATDLARGPSAYGDDALAPPAQLLNGGKPMPKATGDPVCPATPTTPSTQTTIDVIPVTTNGFRSKFGAGYSTRIDFLLNAINTYYTASHIAITLRRVGTLDVTIDETLDDGTLLDAITNSTAPFENIPVLRALTGADMVPLLRNTGSNNSISGVAWIGAFNRSSMSGSSGIMFSINGDAPAFTDATLMAHEMGHNMGNNHDRANAGGVGQFGATSYSYGFVNCGNGVINGSPAGAVCPTSAGFYTMQTGFGTIMSYYRPTIARFESPNVTCTRGAVTSACGVDDSPASAANTNPGTDTVRSMNCVRAAISSFMPDRLACADMADSDNDGIPNCVESKVGRVSGTRDNDVFAATALGAQLFTMQQYRDFLSREAELNGLDGWMHLIASGTTHEQVINAFFNSIEFNGTVAPVVRLYFAAFLRVPDYAGLTFNAGLVRNGTITITQLADYFTQSPEFMQAYGSLDNTQFVTLLYHNVLNRQPDQAGLNGWVSMLNAGTSRGTVLMGFSESTEFVAAKFNEVYVTMMYVGMLRRSPDSTGYNGWLTYLRNGNSPLNMISGFYNATEYHNRFLP